MAENLSRVEDILDATIDGTEYTDSPLSRVEQKLLELKQMISEGISPADTATIRQAVTDYLATHPIEGVDESTVNALIADYIDEHPIEGDSADLSPLWNAMADEGVKNLLPFPYKNYNGEEQPYTSNGLAFLAKSDNSYKGRVDVSSEDNTYPITVGSSNSEYSLYRAALEARDFMQKGMPFKLVSTRSLPSGVKIIATIGGITLAEVSNESRTANFTITDDLKSGGFGGREVVNISIVVPVGTTITESFAVWPMLTYANVTDLEFDEPGLLNVKDINEKIKDISDIRLDLDALYGDVDNHESRIQSLEQNGDPGESGTSAETVTVSTIPKVFLTGDVSDISKDNPKDLLLEYKDGAKSFNATANIKWQGSSSLSYPKKNFTIKLYKDTTKAEKKKVDVGFGNQSKYVLKANYIDHSHARNIVCARLWGDIVASRTNKAEIPTELLSSPNNGAVDGFPIKLYLNGVYQGIYTWNIPKDGWMMGMDSDNPNHAILVAEGNRGDNYATQFRRTTNFKEDTAGEWTIEFPDADQFSDDLKTSFNNLLTFVSTSSDEDFVANLSNYANVQSLIDYYIFAYLICGLDILGKNLLMCTFDGTHWFASAYDLDSTFGLWWNGSKFVSESYRCPEDYQENNSLLWQRLERLFTDAIKERYSVLRSGPMSVTNVICRFEGFTDLISQDLYDEDGTIYSGIPSKTTNNIRQIRSYYVNRCAYVDGEMQTLGIVTLSGITATKTTQQYNVGDTVDTSDITVVASYSDGTSNDVTSSAVIDTSAVDTSTDGTYQIAISYTEDDVTVTTACTITVGEGSQEPVVDDNASFTPALTCAHNQALNPGDIGDGSVYRDYLVHKTNNHSFVTTTANSMPIYTDETRATIAGYAIPVPATAQKVNLSYSNAKTSTYIRFVDNDLQFIGDEVSFLQTQNASYEFSNLSKHPKWINIVGSGSSQSSAASLVLTFE